MDKDLIETVGLHYHTTLVNFFLPLGQPDGPQLYRLLVETVDDVQVNVNWYIPSLNVIRESLYTVIRSDMRVFSALVKLERLMAVKLALLGVEEQFVGSLAKMFHRGGVATEVVDNETAVLLTAEGNAANKINAVQMVPGLVALLTAIQYRHVWQSIKEQ